MPDLNPRYVIKDCLPDRRNRKAVLRLLLDSCEFAEALGPDCWAVTLFNHGFRLNVGKIEVMTLRDSTVRLLLLANTGHPALGDGREFCSELGYDTPSGDHCVFSGSIADWLRFRQLLLPYHRAFIKDVGLRNDGTAVRSPHLKTHSDALIEYARTVEADDTFEQARYFVLQWTPDTGRTDESYFSNFNPEDGREGTWSCGNTSTINSGDIVILRRTVKTPLGLVGYGEVITGSYAEPDEPEVSGFVHRMVRVHWRQFRELPLIAATDERFARVEKLWGQKNGASLSTEVGKQIIAAIDAAIEQEEYSAVEGKRTVHVLSKIERDDGLKRHCIAHYGNKYCCEICGMDFKRNYGPHASDFIHVHHLYPLMNGLRETNPVTDLLPVCPNCHAMLHYRQPPREPLAPDAIQERLRAQAKADPLAFSDRSKKKLGI